MVLRNYGHVLQLDTFGQREARPLAVFHAHHTAICSRPQDIFRVHRQCHGGVALDVQIAMLGIDSIDADRCRSPNNSLRSSSERLDTVAPQSFSTRQRCDLFVPKTVPPPLRPPPTLLLPAPHPTPPP